MPKRRLNATVDAELLAAVRTAARGSAQTISAWVSDAFRLKLEREHSLRRRGRTPRR